ncbi:alpha/beta hydrolase [Rhizobium sp. TRM95111]|uniref:alpha/beta fold hydrolase n=1 Tax=Rhizobium alarense TaxID=2846851 RepID=UPI001F47843C|nr:alpha/beta hydrolase [Rhizobium alarense]MCF3639348.1 alpha/beta hydrolase [Rhizobium alarense]
MFDDMFRLASPTGALLACHRAPAEGPAIGILLLSHGLSEHSRRYRRFAERVAKAGFHVYAHDHRGHGETTAPDAPFGRFAQRAGARAVQDDLFAVRNAAVERHPGLPVVVFGHSMGGLIALNFAETYPDRLDALAVWNSNFDAGLAGRAGQAILLAERMLKGSDVPSALLPRLTFGAWGRSIADRRSAFDWLSHDPAAVAAYVADPRCGFDASVSLWIDLFDLIYGGIDAANIARLPRRLPIHLVAGGEDPATDRGRAIRRLAERLEKSSLENVTTIVYPEARHETLNEIAPTRDRARDDFITWCRSAVQR